MRTFVTFLLLTVASQMFGQTGKLFKGTITKTIKVNLYLEGLDESTYADLISGAYKYDDQKEYILLNGYRNNDGNIVLTELATANFSGVFLGTMNENTINGKWISANQKKSYEFNLFQVVATTEQLTTFQNAMEDKANEFSSY